MSVADEKLQKRNNGIDDLPDDVDSALAQYDYNVAKAMQVFSDAVEDGKFLRNYAGSFGNRDLLHENGANVRKIPEQTMM